MSKKKQSATEIMINAESNNTNQGSIKVDDVNSIATNMKNTDQIITPANQSSKINISESIDSSISVNTNTIKVTQVGSSIARNNNQAKTLTGLGLGKIGRTRILENTPSILGMINKVKHLVKVDAA